MNKLKIFKVLEPISTLFHGRFPYYFSEPYDTRIIDGVHTEEPKIEEIELDLNKLKVEIKEFASPFSGKLRKYYFFKYNDEDIYIEDFDSTSETYIEKIVKKLDILKGD